MGRARELSLLYLPSLMQSHTDCSVISGHIDCIVVVTDLTSLVMRACLRVPFSHSTIPYITILNLRSLAALLDAPLRFVAFLEEVLFTFGLAAAAYEPTGLVLWEGEA